MKSLLVLPLLLVFGCEGPPPTLLPDTCPTLLVPTAELSQSDEWGMQDGDPVAFGIPPQGGAPFAPFGLRVWGMSASVDGYEIEMSAFERSTGELIGTASYEQRFVCANVPPNEGSRVTSELHMRFFGFEPDEIAGIQVDVEIEIRSPESQRVDVAFSGPLAWVLGPMP